MGDNIPPDTLAGIDKFVQTLVERLQKPKNNWLSQPTAVDETKDTKFKDCPKELQSYIGNVLGYRAAFGAAPPQYEQLRAILEKTVPQRSPKDKYNNPKVEFAYRMGYLLMIISDPSFSKTNLKACKPYGNVVSLLDASDKEKAAYAGLFNILNGIVRKVKNKIENKEADEVIAQMKTAYSTDLKAKMPAVPYGTPSLPEEPVPNFSDEDVSAAMTYSAPVSKAPLTPADNMKIAGIAAQITKKPEIIARGLTSDQIRQIATNIYRKKTGKGRKTYRRKKYTRKTRKVRRM